MITNLSVEAGNAFLFQGLLFIAPLVGSYLTYLLVRAPSKSDRDRQSLVELGFDNQNGNLDDTMQENQYHWYDYLLPLVFLCLLISAMYAMTHPYVIQSGLWEGVLEVQVDIFGQADPMERAKLAGRFMFWGWAGAYIYAFHMIWRRFLAFDLTPNVYVFAANRFALSLVIGAIAGISIGMLSETADPSMDTKLTLIYMTLFFIGFFPERGIDWLSLNMGRTLGMAHAGPISRETRLSELEGLSIWHQNRLRQEGIENVQNLATSDIPALIIGTPFSVGQIVDWIDQSLLIMYADSHSESDMYNILETCGVRCASDFIAIASHEARITQLAEATAINVNRLRMLCFAVQSATNIQATAHYRWLNSMDPERRQAALAIRPFEDTPTRRNNALQLSTDSYKSVQTVHTVA